MTSKDHFRTLIKANKKGPQQLRAALNEVNMEFARDFERLRETENPQTNGELFSIFARLDGKWNRLRARLEAEFGTHQLKPNGFSEILRQKSPKALKLYEDYKAKRSLKLQGEKLVNDNSKDQKKENKASGSAQENRAEQ